MYYTLYAIIMLGNVMVFNQPLHVDITKAQTNNQQTFPLLCARHTKELRDSLKDALELPNYKGIRYTCYTRLEYNS